MKNQVIEAKYDGSVFIPLQPVPLPAGQVVRLVIEALDIPARMDWDEFFRDLARRPPRNPDFDFSATRRESIYGNDEDGE